MLLLLGPRPLNSTEEFQSRLASGLREYFHVPQNRSLVTVQGILPALDLIRVDLSSARIKLSETPPVPGQVNTVKTRLSARKLQLDASPLHWEQQAQLSLHLKGESVDLIVLEDDRQQTWLSLASAERGSVRVNLGEGQIEKLLLDGISLAAAKHGLTVQGGRVSLRESANQSLSLTIEVQGKKAFLKGGITVSGQLRLDEHLNIHPTDLTCSGQGVLGKIAIPFLGPLLAKWEAKPLPLLGHTFGELKCRQLHIEAGPRGALHVRATF